jgi:hypothetical protein
MDLSRLGPLEKSIIKALLRAETAGAPLSVPQIWRSLPSYSTHLSNVLGALAEGSALASFLSEARGQYVLRDQEHLLSEFGQQRQRADALWTELQGVVESLCREPVIHGLALAGSMAWGMPPAPGQPTELFVIAVPRKTLDAAAAVQLVGANLAHDQGLAASEVVAVDELVLAPGDLSRALELLSLRPILSESAFMTLWEHNGWLEEAFPNFDLVSRLGGDIPDVLLGEVLEDRRFILRRLLSRRVRRIGGAVRRLPSLSSSVRPCWIGAGRRCRIGCSRIRWSRRLRRRRRRGSRLGRTTMWDRAWMLRSQRRVSPVLDRRDAGEVCADRLASIVLPLRGSSGSEAGARSAVAVAA